MYWLFYSTTVSVIWGKRETHLKLSKFICEKGIELSRKEHRRQNMNLKESLSSGNLQWQIPCLKSGTFTMYGNVSMHQMHRMCQICGKLNISKPELPRRLQCVCTLNHLVHLPKLTLHFEGQGSQWTVATHKIAWPDYIQVTRGPDLAWYQRLLDPAQRVGDSETAGYQSEHHRLICN